MHLEKMTPPKSSQQLLSVLQESVEPQPRGVFNKEGARSPALGLQKQMNPKKNLRPFQRSGEEWIHVGRWSHCRLGSRVGRSEWERDFRNSGNC